jgi:NAD(P)-dependent dehydrogenase (short-subunit alcohol dehydrogenase family)
MELAERRAFVTGAGGRIGRVICEVLAREGADVAAMDLDLEGAHQVAAMVDQAGRRSAAIQGNVSSADEVERAIRQAEDTIGQIDVLVNVAAIFPSSLLLAVSEDEWDRVFDINVKGTMLTCRAFGKRWVERGTRGAIVNISSGAGTSARLGGAAYCGSKAAVNMLTQALAIELGPHGIRVNVVSPGLVMDEPHTPSDAGLSPYVRLNLEATPMGRSGMAVDIARAVAFLASEQSAWTTGAIFDVSGGSHCGRPYLPLPQEG